MDDAFYLLVEQDLTTCASGHPKCCPSSVAMSMGSPNDVSYAFGAGFVIGALLGQALDRELEFEAMECGSHRQSVHVSETTVIR